ncbi:MAG: efflux RND transporter periplasmic adaptor subunit [Planctomycetota bacterium]
MTKRSGTSAFLLAAATLIAGCGKPPEPAKPAEEAEITVRTTVAESRAVKRIRRLPGNTESVRGVTIAARVTGFLEKQHVDDGAMVKSGDLLFTIDRRPFQVALDQAKASKGQAMASVDSAAAAVVQAKAQVPGARAARDVAARDVERNRPLAESGALSKQSFDQMTAKLEQAESTLATAEATVTAAEAQRRAAEAAVATADAQVEAAELNLGYCEVRSPLAGLLGKSAVTEGQMVGPGYAVTMNEVVQLDPMWVAFSPSATEWPLIRERLAAGGVPVEVVYGGHDSIRASGDVTFASNEVDVSTSTISMRATFPNTDGAFRPGTYCGVNLDLGEIPGVVMIPTSALVARETDFFVWRVKQDDTVENIRVEATIRESDMVGISEGVKAGDRIVVAGTQKLKDGAKVVEQGAAPAAKAEK